jgi:hypothetical protein
MKDAVQMFKDGMSFGVIARELGISRGAVAGRVWRAGASRKETLPAVRVSPMRPGPKSLTIEQANTAEAIGVSAAASVYGLSYHNLYNKVQRVRAWRARQ